MRDSEPQAKVITWVTLFAPVNAMLAQCEPWSQPYHQSPFENHDAGVVVAARTAMLENHRLLRGGLKTRMEALVILCRPVSG